MRSVGGTVTVTVETRQERRPDRHMSPCVATRSPPHQPNTRRHSESATSRASQHASRCSRAHSNPVASPARAIGDRASSQRAGRPRSRSASTGDVGEHRYPKPRPIITVMNTG